jgi:hypothetical protein
VDEKTEFEMKLYSPVNEKTQFEAKQIGIDVYISALEVVHHHTSSP